MVPEIRSETDIFSHFLPFNPHNDPENPNFEKMKQLTGDIIFLHTCTINEHHMMYDS